MSKKVQTLSDCQFTPIQHLFNKFDLNSIVVVSYDIQSKDNFDITIRLPIVKDQYPEFLRHFQQQAQVEVKAKPHGVKKSVGVKVLHREEHVCRYSNHESGKHCSFKDGHKNDGMIAPAKVLNKDGQPFEMIGLDCKAFIMLRQFAPVVEEPGKRCRRLERDPYTRSHPTEAVFSWRHETHNIGVLAVNK